MHSSVPPSACPQRSLNTEVPSAVLTLSKSITAAIPIKTIPTHNRRGTSAWTRTTPSNTVNIGTIKYCETYRRTSICNTSRTTMPARSRSNPTANGENVRTASPPETFRANSSTASPISPPINISATVHSIAIPRATLRHATQAAAIANGGTSNPTYVPSPMRRVTGNICEAPPSPISPGQNSTEPSLITATIIGTKHKAPATFTGRAATPPTTTPNELKASKPTPTADNRSTSRTPGTALRRTTATALAPTAPIPQAHTFAVNVNIRAESGHVSPTSHQLDATMQNTPNRAQHHPLLIASLKCVFPLR
jgi:hypothetical protein